MSPLLRSIVAIVVGFVLIGALSVGTDALLVTAMPGAFDADHRTNDPRLLLLILAYVGVYATFGCYVTARLAPSHPMRHALILGALGLALNVVVTAAQWGTLPLWYLVLGVGTTMLWAWLGGWLRERELARRGHADPMLAR